MNRRRRKGSAKDGAGKGPPKFWGRHAVEAAIANPNRRIHKIWATREALAQFEVPADIPIAFCEVTDLARLVSRDAPHQGIVAEVAPLEDIWLQEVIDNQEGGDRPLLVLDQITDPHNVGALFRSAAAFNAAAIITQDRHAPPESGTLAKAASGALEIIPWVRVVNLARTLEEIAEHGYWRIGLTGHTDIILDEALTSGRNALVLGAEGEGMRHNIEEHCDQLAKLPIHSNMESLNVSNAGAIALYAEAMKKKAS